MKTTGIIKILIGLLLMLVAVYVAVFWWLPELVNLIQGALPTVFFLIGLVFVLLGFED